MQIIMDSNLRESRVGHLSYSLMRVEETRHIANFIADVFMHDVAPQYGQEGIEEFLSFINPDAIKDRSRKNHFILVARESETLVGAIEIRDCNHISLFFVEPGYQRQGIGKALLDAALKQCKGYNPGLAAVTINSSPNAVTAYERLGFRRLDHLQIKNGIAYVPMSLTLISTGET